VVTVLRTKDGHAIPYDPLAYDDFAAARSALEALEKRHGELEFDRDHRVEDLKVMKADFLIRHVEGSFAAWRRCPQKLRVSFPAFLEHVLPYRGSQEPLDDWLGPLSRRYAGLWKKLDDGSLDPAGLYHRLARDVHGRVGFDERYYLHPTDQGFTEMSRSGQGRCEDITNMITYAARSMALATAADYTPAWAHRDNNHAWNVLLDRDGRGFDKVGRKAAKVYRKTFAIQRHSLPFELPAGRPAPNRFLASRTAEDVTDQYGPTTDVHVRLGPQAAGERHAYACVFNGGDWVALQWGRVADGQVTFDRMGRDFLMLPATHDGTKLVPAAAPRLVHADGTIEVLPGTGAATAVTAVAVRPVQVSPDTHAATPVSHLQARTTYVLRRWTPAGWSKVTEVVAGKEPLHFDGLAADGLYWLVAKDSRRLERPWTITPEGLQRWW
jgi:hypothetical protein